MFPPFVECQMGASAPQPAVKAKISISLGLAGFMAMLGSLLQYGQESQEYQPGEHNIPDQDAVRQPADPEDLRWQGQLTPRNYVLGKSFAEVLMEVGREVADLVFSLPHRKRQA
jgi:hypothetical protein